MAMSIEEVVESKLMVQIEDEEIWKVFGLLVWINDVLVVDHV